MKYLNNSIKAFFLWCFFASIAGTTSAQNGGPAVLQWRSFLPYQQVVDFAYDNNIFYCATTTGFFTYNRANGSLEAFSKTNGMHDIGLSAIAYDATTGTAVLAYTNSNIDLLQHHQFYNIPDIKISQTSGNKSVFDVIAREGTAYLSTGIGLILLNLEKREVKSTVVFYDSSLAASVYSCAIIGDSIYAATDVGLFSSNVTNPFIQNYGTWKKLSPVFFRHLGVFDGDLYAAADNSVYKWTPGGMQLFKTAPYPVVSLDGASNGLWVSAYLNDDFRGTGHLLDAGGSVIDTVPCRTPSKIISLNDGEVWYSDESRYAFVDDFGLRKKLPSGDSRPFFPKGPIVNHAYDVSAYNGELWVAHGGYSLSWKPIYLRAMFSHFANGTWTNYPWVSDDSWFQDFSRVLINPTTGEGYFGSFSGGLLIMNPDGSWKVYGDGYLPNFYGSGGTGDVLHFVSGLALDDEGNLWIANYGGDNELTVRTPDGHWYQSKQITNNLGDPPHSAADVVIDDYGQKWFIAPESGAAIVYDDAGTISNNADDRYRMLWKGEGNGNLPGNATCIAVDNDGAVWIGTDNGIGIVNCPGDAISGECEASLKIVQFDEFADYLFVKQTVRAIAVDAANRKWVGTSNGVWLISPDAEKIIYRFTASNSPLPSDFIQRINIDPVTGDVYFSTDKGLVAFRSTATAGTAENNDPLLIYPNPVPSGYQGMIAVRGVAEGADVRFTDISGHLVYRTTALGGQAVWDGKDYTGHKVESGVYLIFVVSKDGTQKTTGKVMIYK